MEKSPHTAFDFGDIQSDKSMLSLLFEQEQRLGQETAKRVISHCPILTFSRYQSY